MTEQKVTRRELEDARYRGNAVFGHFRAYCWLHDCCDVCNPWVRLLCILKDRLEALQTKIIFRMCIKEDADA